MDLGLNDKTVLITGSNRGTGWVIAHRFASEGARVITHAIDPAAEYERPANSHSVAGDITSADGARAVAEAALAATGSLDVLVNNYGSSSAATWGEGTAEDWHHIYGVNAVSVMHMVQNLLPALRASAAGRIVNLGTNGVDRPGKRNPHYYASKAALVTMTQSLAREAGPEVTVNLVSPGLIRTPEVEAAWLERGRNAGWGDTWEAIEPKVVEAHFPNPLGRIATREEVADAVVFLASARAAFLSGQNLRVDGGGTGVA